MDLASYAELAVRLVNTRRAGADTLTTVAAVRDLLSDRPTLRHLAEESALPPMRALRDDLGGVFDAAADGDHRTAVERLNTLLTAYPIRPQVTGHDGHPWHLHLAADGSVTEQVGAAAAMGLATLVAAEGLERLGRCAAAGCARVYLDTSSNRSRRYCGERCASRANVAAYRARRRASMVGEGQ
ncbi:MAG TPA: CGNR zinc finger domain-containing protein [Streptosporangiaceae bacterium]